MSIRNEQGDIVVKFKDCYELQSIDCNCNNCVFMKRDVDKFKRSVELHFKWQKDYYNTIRSKIVIKGLDWIKKGDSKKGVILLKEARAMKFQFNKSEAAINYGYCDKFNKDVSFIPGTCQLDTQECFQNRRSLPNP